MKYFAICLTILLISSMHANPQERELRIRETQPVAKEALETFKKLVTEENFNNLGFDSLEEIRSAVIGTPLVDYMVRLDMLRKFDSRSNPSELLTPTNLVYYPLIIKKQTKSSITISKIKEQWQAVSYGGANIIKIISKTLNENSKSTRVDPSSYFIVRIPSLNLYFLGYYYDDELMLVPTIEDSRFEFRANESISAEKVFSSVLPYAESLDEETVH